MQRPARERLQNEHIERAWQHTGRRFFAFSHNLFMGSMLRLAPDCNGFQKIEVRASRDIGQP
jgi:hypothetical protein